MAKGGGPVPAQGIGQYAETLRFARTPNERQTTTKIIMVVMVMVMRRRRRKIRMMRMRMSGMVECSMRVGDFTSRAGRSYILCNS